MRSLQVFLERCGRKRPLVPDQSAERLLAPPRRLEIILKEETSLAEIIREKDFLPILETNAQAFFASCNTFLENKIDKINKRIIGHLHEESELLVSFLDDYNARNNKVFAYFSEIVACIRNLIRVCYLQRHILRRYFKYHLDDDVAQVAQFHLSSGESFEFLINSLTELAKEVYREAREVLGLKIKHKVIERLNLPDPIPKSTLPDDITEDLIANPEQPIVEISTVYLKAAKEIASISEVDRDSPNEIKDFVTLEIPEERVRNLEATVHGLQSKYDTHVKGTRVELKDETLLKLRGHISMALHLLEYTTGLVHFYERHETDIRSVEAKRGIARLVDKNEILRLIVNYGFHYARLYIMRGQPYAEILIKQHTVTIKMDLTLPEGLYLHARPVTLIVSIVHHHGMPVQMEIEGEKVEANSIIQLLMACGGNHKTRKVTFYGDEKPLNDLKALFEARLGENGPDSLPPSLHYLKKV